MEWVIDSSLALAWGLPDETSMRADRFLRHVSADDALWVPALWWYEISNALVMAQRRRRLTEADRLGLVTLYGRLPLHTDTHLNPETVGRLQVLAQEHSLSAYDAAYLELATRKGLGLVTLDQRLMAAARNAGIRIEKADKHT
jgi:predicted nucleic acid-binding protein